MAASFRIAALVTTFFPNSHAGGLVSKFLTGFPTDDGLVAPRTRIASLYLDQIHRHDIGLQLARRYGVPVYGSVRSALTLGGDELAVDGVLLIGEHGDYPRTVLGQEMLPRRWFFEQVSGVIAEERRPLPVFVDKHLSYRWSDARWMYDTARELGMPLWAGSSLPMHWRRPDYDHPRDSPLDAALSTGFHMLERYGFQFAYAGRRAGSIDAFAFQPDPSPNKAHFGYFGLNVEDFLLSCTPPSPVERTLLTTGILEAAMISNHRGGERVATPHPDIAYAPGAHGVRRPTAPHPGAAVAGSVPLPEPGATPAAEPIPIDRDGTVRRSSAARPES